MIVENGTVVQLVIRGLYDGPAGRQGKELAFPPPRGRLLGMFSATIDGEPARLRLERPTVDGERSALIHATIL